MHGNPNVFAVGFQNKQISLYDTRENSLKPSMTKTAHNGEIYALDFNRFAQNLLLSGDENNDIFLWDIRNMSKKFNSFIGHNDYITSLQWSNYKETQFVSGSADRRIVMWNISQIGA
jgi:histone-binding protein RBBP4